ncbi:DNA mismatch repair endonuclease MutL [Planctomicrobium sp. SH664]|uniref:DNA mismatch repair endonuclease MutL n=1 Tax=Planctomicrobium sp. SH664 TaxID=3448125 RepID=UPI003F5B7588
MSTTVPTQARIQRLSTSVINKIAAGEVIERPASVVKELLENSVDALSTRITVDIEQGGSELIRIVDDGEGIHPDDIELAIASHATSKLRDADDLFGVATLGFRGEALASIAEISQLTLRTKQRDQPTGVQMEVHAGVVKEHRPCGCPDGTQFEVRQLFYSTPVRRGFMKSPATEFGHIAEQFTRIALANPNLHMTLRHNQRLVHDLPPTQQLQERLELFFGGELASQLIPVEAEHNGTRIWGFAAHPSQSKTTRRGQYLFLNGRWITDRSLQHALSEAYRGLVMVGRYPVAFLFLELAPNLVDVNVHPTKAEVRFRDSQTLYRLLLSTLRNRFLTMDLDSRLSVDRRSSAGVSAGEEAPPREEQWQQKELATWAKQSLQREISRPVDSWTETISALAGPLEPRQENPADRLPLAEPIPAAEIFAEGEGRDDLPAPRTALPVAVEQHASHPATAAAEVRAMQVHDCYLVVETTDGITVIDQHALHERIMYEQLRKRVLAGGVEVQKLLIPITVDLPARDASILLDQTDVLAELGLHLQDFGGNTVALCGYPVLLKRADPEQLLKDVVELLESTSRKLERRDLIDSLLHMMSCKAAIKAGQRLSFEEMEALLAQRHLCDDAHHCPHGRPTALKLSRDELDRQFGRLG